MRLFADLAIALVALCHAGFLFLEMFLWERPVGRRIFGMSREQAALTAPLAKNQGLYNGFLAAGLIWGCFGSERALIDFLLACVVVAGVYGAATVKRSILFVQALPAATALLLLWLS